MLPYRCKGFNYSEKSCFPTLLQIVRIILRILYNSSINSTVSCTIWNTNKLTCNHVGPENSRLTARCLSSQGWTVPRASVRSCNRQDTCSCSRFYPNRCVPWHLADLYNWNCTSARSSSIYYDTSTSQTCSFLRRCILSSERRLSIIPSNRRIETLERKSGCSRLPRFRRFPRTSSLWTVCTFSSRTNTKNDQFSRNFQFLRNGRAAGTVCWTCDNRREGNRILARFLRKLRRVVENSHREGSNNRRSTRF